ncbi:hypothetical protein ABZ695_31820 [Streptomyces sp. NPDC006976]|uniref:hypothetical protein n=1 Tax=Streptomyces sp. NPDC006976 TaxID=3154311 RepID=UPI0033D24C41
MVVQRHRSGGGVRGVRALAMAVVMAAAAGCAGDGGGDRATAADARDGAVEVVRRAAAVLAGEGVASAEVSTSMETASGGTRVTIRGKGAYDFRAGSGRLTVVLPPDAAGEEEHRPITELLAPGALYMMNRGAGVPADKWVRIDTTALEDGNLVTGGVTDPMAAAELLRGAGAVTYVGETDLAGVTVRHYRGTADIGRAARLAAAPSRASLVAAAKGFRTVEVPFDAYLDGQGRLRKVRHRFSPTGEGPAAEVVSTTLLYGFGVPVTVTLPDERDIYTGEIEPGRARPDPDESP